MYNFLPFLDNEGGFFVYRHKYFLTTAFYWYRNKFRRKVFFSEKKNLWFIFFRRRAKHFWPLSKNFRRGRENCIVLVHRDKLTVFFWKKYVFSMFCGLWAMFFLSLTKRVFGEVVKTNSCVSIGKIWLEKKTFMKNFLYCQSFWDLEWIDFRNLSKTSWQVSNDYSLLVHTIFLKKKFFQWKFLFFTLSERWAKQLWPIVGTISGWSSKLHFTCPREHFQHFLSQNSKFFLILEPCAIFLALYWKIINKVVKTPFRVSAGTLWWDKSFYWKLSDFSISFGHNC